MLSFPMLLFFSYQLSNHNALETFEIFSAYNVAFYSMLCNQDKIKHNQNLIIKSSIDLT